MAKTTSLSVLYVEDDDDIPTIGLMALADVGGLNVRPCSSADEAICAVDTFSPDVLLLDFYMPGKDGVRLLAELRAKPQTARCPAVFMTGAVSSRERDYYRGVGAVGVISKPFDPFELPKQLHSIVLAAIEKSAKDIEL